MRTPHFVLAALVALATSFSLHAAAWQRLHGGYGRFGRGPWGHYAERWGHRFGPGAYESPFADGADAQRTYGPRPPVGQLPPRYPAPADSAPSAR